MGEVGLDPELPEEPELLGGGEGSVVGGLESESSPVLEICSENLLAWVLFPKKQLLALLANWLSRGLNGPLKILGLRGTGPGLLQGEL